MLAIPCCIGDPFSLFLFFKQNVLQYLNSLSLNVDSEQALKNQFLAKHKNISQPTQEPNEYYLPFLSLTGNLDDLLTPVGER